MGIVERKEREKQQRKIEIVDAAEKVFFTRGYGNSTMDDVAKEVELSKGTLYLYFKSKEEVYHAIVQRGIKTLNQMFEDAVVNKENGICKVRAIGEAFVRFFFEYSNYHDAMIFDQAKTSHMDCDCETEIMNLEVKKKTNEILIDAIQEGIDDGTIRKDLDPVMTSILLWGSTMGVLQLVRHKGEILSTFFKKDGDQIINEYFDFIYKSISS